VKVACDDPDEHRIGWVSIAGVGWKCLTCEIAHRDEAPAFHDRVPRPGTRPAQEADDDRPF